MRLRFFLSILLALFLIDLRTNAAVAQNSCTDAFQGLLEQRYGVKPNEVVYTPNDRIPVIIKMDDHSTLRPKIDPKVPLITEVKVYDTVIVGAGPAGLTAALYLAEAGKSVLVLERNEKAGGLGLGSELKGVRAGGGAAYSAGPEGPLENQIFQKIGLKNYKRKIKIEEPIDSYLWKGRLYKGIWEDHTLSELPASFALFKFALLRLYAQGANETSGAKAEWADNMDMATLVRQMPLLIQKWKTKEARDHHEAFIADPRIPKTDPMIDVIELLDLYGRSALGGPTHKISARQFIDFYASEIYTRYTGTLGTGTVSEHLLKTLKQYPNVEIRTATPVAEIETTAQGTRTVFLQNGAAHEVKSRKMIYSAPISLATGLIKGFEKGDPERAKLLKEMEMTDYAVHVARVKGHPFRATYDTWSHANGDLTKPSDFILGRWQDSRIKAYKGMRNFEKDPKDDYGVISIYQPLGKSDVKHFSKAQYLVLVENAVRDMLEKMGPLAAKEKQKIEVELVESYRWPDSIHIVAPGALQRLPILEKPYGNIRFATNTVGAPELESAMGRAANEAMALIEDDAAAMRASQL